MALLTSFQRNLLPKKQPLTETNALGGGHGPLHPNPTAHLQLLLELRQQLDHHGRGLHLLGHGPTRATLWWRCWRLVAVGCAWVRGRPELADPNLGPLRMQRYHFDSWGQPASSLSPAPGSSRPAAFHQPGTPHGVLTFFQPDGSGSLAFGGQKWAQNA